MSSSCFAWFCDGHKNSIGLEAPCGIIKSIKFVLPTKIRKLVYINWGINLIFGGPLDLIVISIKTANNVYGRSMCKCVRIAEFLLVFLLLDSLLISTFAFQSKASCWLNSLRSSNSMMLSKFLSYDVIAPIKGETVCHFCSQMKENIKNIWCHDSDKSIHRKTTKFTISHVSVFFLSSP